MTKHMALGAALAALALTLTAGTALAATAVARQGVNIRAAASTDARIIGQLAAGEEVEVVECGGGWCALEDGGYVAQSYLAIAAAGSDDDDEDDEDDEDDDALDDDDDEGPAPAFDPDEGGFDEDPLDFEELTPQSLQELPEDDDEDDDGD